MKGKTRALPRYVQCDNCYDYGGKGSAQIICWFGNLALYQCENCKRIVAQKIKGLETEGKEYFSEDGIYDWEKG